MTAEKNDIVFKKRNRAKVRKRRKKRSYYYPFGLTMAGISSSAAGGLENRKKYNGIEYDSSFGIDEYEAHYRDLDPQTGRFLQIDPKIEDNQESTSPYTSMANDPTRNSDPLGDEPCCGLWEPDRKGNIVEPTNTDFAEHPIKSMMQEVGFLAVSAVGFNFFDNLGADLGNPNLSGSDKVKATVSSVGAMIESAGPDGLSVEGGVAGEIGTVAKSETKVILPDNATVVRGGLNKVENLKAGIDTHPSGVTGVSVECGTCSVKELSKPLPHNQIGVTTVGDVRKAGGDVIKTSGKSPNHATMTGITPEQMNKILTPTTWNPNKQP